MLTLCVALSGAAPLHAQSDALPKADVVLLGEYHDNPDHHATQARLVAQIAPRALVFEMLTAGQAAAGQQISHDDFDSLQRALGWNDSGWPDFSVYFPIFKAAPEAVLYGAALPRPKTRAAFKDGAAAVFGDGAAGFGLTNALPEPEQKAREALQFEAHCAAMPDHLMAGMVDVQRLRDAELARAVQRAFSQTGGPVAVILGNGHARADWGVPVYLAKAVPDASVLTIGQGEDGVPPPGRFDRVLQSGAPERDDPCAAFNK